MVEGATFLAYRLAPWKFDLARDVCRMHALGARKMSQPTSTTIISAYRATSVVDTPMRKVEVLEAHDGRVIIRATEFENSRAHVFPIHLEHHEALALADTLANLEAREEGEETAVPPENRHPASLRPVLVSLHEALANIINECEQAVERALTPNAPFETISADKL